MNNARPALLIALLTGLGCLAALPQARAASGEADLHKINKEIHSTQARLRQNQQQQDKLADSLEQAEQALSRIESEKNALAQAIGAQQQELDSLHRKETQLQAAKADQEKNIAAQINASYRLGLQKNVRIILNQQDSRSLSRSLAYSDYLARSRLVTLNSFAATLNSLTENRHAIESKTAELLASQTALSDREARIKTGHKQRNDALRQLQAVIKSDESKISQLKTDQARLQALLRKIRSQQLAAEQAAKKAAAQAREEQARKQASTAVSSQASHIAPTPPSAPTRSQPGDHLPFAQARGKLRWPVQGQLDNRFGRPRQPGDFRWEGIAFLAASGSNIQAIHAGKVVFADWFRGKGLLLIIDHGNGYMTLYAHNQTLLKKTGDTVRAGDNIATLGNSGGLTRPELYFELRHQGQPVNPTLWLSKNG